MDEAENPLKAVNCKQVRQKGPNFTSIWDGTTFIVEGNAAQGVSVVMSKEDIARQLESIVESDTKNGFRRMGQKIGKVINVLFLDDSVELVLVIWRYVLSWFAAVYGDLYRLGKYIMHYNEYCNRSIGFLGTPEFGAGKLEEKWFVVADEKGDRESVYGLQQFYGLRNSVHGGGATGDLVLLQYM